MTAWKLAYHANCWGALGGDAVGVTSITQLAYRTFGQMDRAFAQIAAAGYAGVEVFDGNLLDHSPADFRSLLANSGLQLVAAYAGGNFIFDDILPEELARVTRAADRAAELGTPHLVVGGGAKRFDGIRESDYQKLAIQLDRVTDMAAASGLTACFHPHLTTIVEGPEQLEKLMKLSKISFCPDTAHLAAGGGDPAALIRKYPDRVRHVHLKDFQKNPFAFLPLGKGELNFSDIFSALKEIDFQGWAVVELDGYDGDPKEAAAISMKFIQEHLG